MQLERWLYTWPLRWRTLIRRRSVEQELHDEIEYHLQEEIDRLVAQGLSNDEARQRVVRRFGGVEQSKERCRDARGIGTVETLLQDVRYGARVLRRNPGFALAAVLTLALGIGVNIAVFSLVDAILLSRLPYPAPDRLVGIAATYPGGAFAALRQESRHLDVATYAEGQAFTLKGNGEPFRVAGTLVSAELFSALAIQPALGRWLRPGEDVAPHDRFVVLSHTLWKTRFNGEAAAVGRFIEIDGVSRQIVAVMPPAFRFPSTRTQIWVPLGLDSRDTPRYWAGNFMPVVGRLRPGATAAQAFAEVRLFQSHVGRLFPWPMPQSWNQDIAVVSLQEALVGPVRSRLLILMTAVAIVLVIACANVANLLLSRAVTREREIGIRTAIGAAPHRIARQLLTESVLLAGIGAAAAVALATPALDVLKRVLPAETPRLAEVHLSWHALVFAAALAIITGCVFGLAPVVQALRLRLTAALEAGGRAGGRVAGRSLRAALTVAQVACAVLLVVAAGLLVRSLWILSRADPGFRTDQVVTALVSPSDSLCKEPSRCLAFYRALASRIEADPQVTGVALTNTLPLTGAVAKRSLDIEGRVVPAGDPAPLIWLNVVTPDYFRVMAIRVESGRAFTNADLSGAAVAIVAASTARRFWPGESPIGKHVRFVGTRGWLTVVGVVADVRGFDLTRSEPDWMKGTVYVPHNALATLEDGRIPTEMMLTLRTSVPAAQVSSLLQRATSAVTGEVVTGEVRTMSDVMLDAVAAPAATTSLLVTMAALALVLGCIGVHGVLAFLVSTRTRDFGIRVALGAQRRDVLWLVVREGATLCAIGIALGFAGAVALTRWLANELHGVSAIDPLTFVAVGALMAIVTVVACYVPTRRAMGVDPLIALRDS